MDNNEKEFNLKPYQWKKGQSGNPKGRKKGSKNFKTLIKKFMAEEVNVFNQKGDVISTDAASAIVITLFSKAINEQDLKAIEMIMDRADGTPTKHIHSSGKVNLLLDDEDENLL